MTDRKKLGDLLLEAGVIDRNQLSTALSHQKRWGGRLGEILVTLNLINENRLLKTLGIVLKLPCVDLSKTKASLKAIKLIKIEIAKKYNVLPLGVKKELGTTVLYLAMSDPTNLSAIDEIQFLTNLTVKPVVATDSSISEAIRFYYEGIGIEEGISLPSDAPTNEKSQGQQEKIDMAVVKDYRRSPRGRPDRRRLSGDSLVNVQGLRALIELLKDKGIITEDELIEKLSRLSSGGS